VVHFIEHYLLIPDVSFIKNKRRCFLH